MARHLRQANIADRTLRDKRHLHPVPFASLGTSLLIQFTDADDNEHHFVTRPSAFKSQIRSGLRRRHLRQALTRRQI